MMNKKILITLGILILLISSVFILMKVNGESEFGVCKTDANREWKDNKCIEKPIEPIYGNQICETGEDGNKCFEDCCVSGDGICPTGCTIANDDDCTEHEKPMTFGIIIDYASYRYPGFWRGLIDTGKSKKQIDLAEELGVDFVRFDIRNEAISSSTEMAKLDEIITYARSKNLKIYIGVYGMDTWYTWVENWKNIGDYSYGGSGKATWEQFKEMYTGEARFLAERYNPDYMMIMVECPFNIGNQVNSVRTINEWVDYTKEVAGMVKSVSPDTRIVLNQIVRKGGGPHGNSEYEFTETIMRDNSKLIDIMGGDPYTYEDLKLNVDNLVEFKNEYNWHGDIWVGETNLLENWDLLSRPSTPQEDEAKKNYFIHAINLAEQNNFNGFVIFYFTDDVNDRNSGIGITYKDFTPKPAYNAIKEIIHKTKEICGNGICETGEDGNKCLQDCCVSIPGTQY